jgi:trehalose 6-phosphate phosphatase
MFEAIQGKKIIDIRPRISWTKGHAVELITKHHQEYPIIYIGDDCTDEDAFRILRNAITILVSKRRIPSAAQYYLKNVGEVVSFLRDLNSWLQTDD